MSVACPGVSVCFVAGQHALIARTIDDGSTWMRQHLDRGGADLPGIFCTATTQCYAVGHRSTVLFTANGGATWTSQALDVYRDLNAVACPSSAVCYAVGNGGIILVASTASRHAAQGSPPRS
jgi:photosystem II stability/assembly factor-like uncharacterized protein